MQTASDMDAEQPLEHLLMSEESMETRPSRKRSFATLGSMCCEKRQRAAAQLQQMRVGLQRHAPIDGGRSAISSRQRANIVDLMGEVGEDFRLPTHAVGLAVSYFDRYMFHCQHNELDFELIALACIFTASKFVLMGMPPADQLCHARYARQSRPYAPSQLYAAEVCVLEALEWELHTATPHSGLELLALLQGGLSERCHERAQDFISISYYMESCAVVSPLLVAAAALLCSLQQVDQKELSADELRRLCEACGEDEASLQAFRLTLLEHLQNSLLCDERTASPVEKCDHGSLFSVEPSKSSGVAGGSPLRSDSPNDVSDPLREGAKPPPLDGGAEPLFSPPLNCFCPVTEAAPSVHGR
mmetsp:Transcript_57803/g.125485  ORF Transcript_57803/g.125485 Transcript_57803/m.125485 type:complete len:359 (+) Transcript_57803:243-1319(+)